MIVAWQGISTAFSWLISWLGGAVLVSGGGWFGHGLGWLSAEVCVLYPWGPTSIMGCNGLNLQPNLRSTESYSWHVVTSNKIYLFNMKSFELEFAKHAPKIVTTIITMIKMRLFLRLGPHTTAWRFLVEPFPDIPNVNNTWLLGSTNPHWANKEQCSTYCRFSRLGGMVCHARN